jgi:Fe2+/Zn2+ uptake regulation proteins
METGKRENFSRKRSAILRILQETNCHPTADWVYAQLKPKYPNLSLGTVYRNLKRFCETGKATSVGVINGQEHFDGNVAVHSHFVCTDCGDIFDVAETFFDDARMEMLSADSGHFFQRAETLFKGTCKECREEKMTA